MKTADPHPIELALLALLLVAEAITVLIAALLALVLSLASWRLHRRLLNLAQGMRLASNLVKAQRFPPIGGKLAHRQRPRQPRNLPPIGGTYRHLSEGQRAVVALKVRKLLQPAAKERQGERTDLSLIAPDIPADRRERSGKWPSSSRTGNLPLAQICANEARLQRSNASQQPKPLRP